MGVAAALAPALAPVARQTVTAPPQVAQRSAHLVQRACDCGAAASLSGRCESCERTSLNPGQRGAASLHAPTLQTVRAATVRRTAPAKPQTSLRVASSGDAAELEAQAVGHQVAHMPDPIGAVHVHRAAEPATILRRAIGQPDMHADALAEIQSGGSGTEMPTRLRLFMEPRFGADFAAVRLHVGDHAAALAGRLGAQAFTVGRDIYFGKGQFQPDSPAGRELIAHELTHTIQQNGIVPRAPHPVARAAPAAPAAASASAKSPAASAPPAAKSTAAAAAPARVAAKPAAATKPPPTAALTKAPAPVKVLATATEKTELAPKGPAALGPPAMRSAAPRPAAPAVSAPAAHVGARAPKSVQRLGISDAWNYFADKANIIPGFRMLTIVLGVNPLNMAPVDRSAANVLRAIIEFIPGGGLIVQALNNSGVFDKVGAWVSDQLATLKMTGSALKDAVTNFLGTLSWSDIFDLGGVWERAKRIFTEPIDHLIAFAKDLVVGILKFIKDAILLPLAKLAEGTAGWPLLIAVLGKNPITGDPVPQTAENLIGGFLTLIHQDEIWANMKKSNAIPRAWAWFKGTMAAVVAFVSQIPDLFIAAFKSLTIEDVVLVVGAFQKVASVFGGFIGKFIDWAGTAIWNLLEIIFDVVSPGALTYIKKTGAALKSILKDPLPFVGNLVKAAKLGFENFAAHFGVHLKSGLIDWLTGSLPGVYIPKAISLVEIGKFALSVLGITWAQIRGKIVKALGPNGEKIMTALETTFDVVVALVKGGPAAAWELIKEKLSDLKDTVMSGLTSFVMDTIVSKAVPKLISLFVPGAGFISAILSIYDTVMVFVNKLAKIVAAVKAFVDSIVAIAAGQIDGAAAKVESTLAGLLSLAINFLAGFLGLGNIADKVMGVIKKVQAVVDKALDTAINWVITKAKALFAKLFGNDKNAGPNDEKWNKAVTAVKADLAQLEKQGVTGASLNAAIPAMREKYGFTSLTLTATPSGWQLKGAMSPEKPIDDIPYIGSQSDPFDLPWPKPAASGYPVLYFGGSTTQKKAQSEMQALVGQPFAGSVVRAYAPTEQNSLPGGEAVGLTTTLTTGTVIGPLSKASTPGGGRINRIFAKYGFGAAAEYLDGDHVQEIQFGGQDVIGNLWPLNASINRGAGSKLAQATVTHPKATQGFKISDLKEDASHKYYFKISSTL